MLVALAACSNSGNTTSAPVDSAPVDSTAVESSEPSAIAELKNITDNYEYGTDYIPLYEQFGSDVTIDEVIEDPETGMAYIERDGVLYTLGLDFLSMAMVYNTHVPEGGRWEDANDVYATWWRLYIQRWNYLLPEIPLYANEYYDVYSTQITGVQEHPTSALWLPAAALIDWGSTKADNSIILGNTTELSGLLRMCTFSSSNPNAADQDVETMTHGYSPVTADKEGNYVWDETVVKSHEEVENDDGTKTFTVEIYDDLKFSDGSPVTAKNYLVRTMLFSSPVAIEANGGVDKQAGLAVVGFDEFTTYDGTEGSGSKEFSGLRLLDEYTFSVTISADYLPYFYDETYVSLACEPLALWLDDNDIVDDGNGAYFTDGVYAKDGDSYTLAAHITAASQNADTTYPYSGPYCVQSFDKATSEAVLVKNEYYKGNYEGTVPSIEKVVYKFIVSETMLDDLKAGGVDLVCAVTGGDDTNAAIKVVEESDGAFDYVHYSRAGYGKLGFRSDFSPTQFMEVRQAVAYCMDRSAFAKTFTGGYGGTVDAPYYTASWQYAAALADGMLLDTYSTSLDSAIAVLEEGGWVYDKDGNEYTSGVRYKQIPAEEMGERDLAYHSADNAYAVTQVGDYYYMPLVLNWYGTTPNPFTDVLLTDFVNNDMLTEAGFYIYYTLGDFNPMLDELYQQPIYGYYSGTPLYNCFNFATGYPSAVYDYAYNLTIDPSMFNDGWNAYFIKDPADAYWL